MAVNKNFVVKNGLEVNDNLLVADIDTQKVGIGTSVSSYELHVLGGIGATDVQVTGITSLGGSLIVGVNEAHSDVTVWGNTNITGITTLASSGGITTTGGDLWVGGDLYVADDLVYDEVTGRNLNITGVSTFAGETKLAGIATFNANGAQITGLSTFDGNVHLLDSDTLYFGGTPGTTTGDFQLFHDTSHSYIRDQGTGDIRVRASGFDVRDSNNTLSILRADASGFMATTGIATVGVASITDVVVAGASTFNGQVTFNYGSISLPNVTGTNLNVTGIGTIGIASISDAVVSGAATFNNDITVLGDLNVTGDLSYDEVTGRNLNITGIATIATLVGYSSEFSGAIGVSSQTNSTSGNKTIVGAAVTHINFIGGGATAFTSTDGDTVNVTFPAAGASIGLAIALGG